MTFTNSEAYWKERYERGGYSGPGSRGRLADWKAEVVNGFVAQHGVQSVIEFGCGDGGQLRLARYPHYLGFDVSEIAVAGCRTLFHENQNTQFARMEDYAGQKADLALSLDVIFHLVEDEVFERHMRQLFAAAQRHVILYTSNTDDNSGNNAAHVRHRHVTRWVESHISGWRLRESIPNRYPYVDDVMQESFCDFHIYQVND